jgi:hypothetical protein
MTSYFITPFDPNTNLNWEVENIDLLIDPKYYRQQLLIKWPAIKIIESAVEISLQWVLWNILKDGQLESCGIGELHKDKKIVSVDTPYEEYFLWHRKIVPSRYQLYLFNESDITQTLELKPDITIDMIERFCGRRGF